MLRFLASPRGRVEALSSKGVQTGVEILVTGAISLIVLGAQRVLGVH